jgi:glycosyltransferase involved in cell wall biosynthesis
VTVTCQSPAESYRVLHVLEATLGGTRRYLEDIAAATADLPIEQGLVYGTARSDSGFADLLCVVRRAGWYLQAADALQRAVHPLADAASMFALRRALFEFKPSLVHVHSAKAGALGRIAALARWPGAPPVVYSPHALPSRLGRAYMLAERLLAPLTRRFIAVSDSERAQIIGEGIGEPDSVDVVYPRIDTTAFAPCDRARARANLGLPQDVPIVIGIGRLAPQKDPFSFVETLARLQQAVPAAVGIWVGDGDLRLAVEERAAALKLGTSFSVAGWQADVRPFIAAGDVLLSTSRYESFGYVIPETFAMERPVVASRVMGTVDVFHPAARCMLYESGRLDQAAKAIEQLIRDKALSMEIGRLGRVNVIKTFSTTAMRAALSTSYAASLSRL